ncbi:MAG: hypothetical protein LBR26_09985 [Prevotella sp.]|jgi:hypothetical protein|nr:hypothetical protein [Prevotella sp.]
MDEDEELYRLMNEEDDFYMGDNELDEPSQSDLSNTNGCAGVFLFMIVLAISIFIYS